MNKRKYHTDPEILQSRIFMSRIRSSHYLQER